MKVVSLITARGGSKGVPRKNIINIKGKPLICYSINASLRSNVSETWVSTEDSEIKEISIECGARVCDRPQHLANDTAMNESALLHFAESNDFDILVFIQPCAPLIKAEYINLGIDMVASGKYDSSFTVVRESWLPRWDMNVNPIGWDIKNRPRRQEKPELYIEAGMFYVTKRNNLISSELRYSGNIGVVEIPLKDSFQIDTIEDLDLIEKLIK